AGSLRTQGSRITPLEDRECAKRLGYKLALIFYVGLQNADVATLAKQLCIADENPGRHCFEVDDVDLDSRAGFVSSQDGVKRSTHSGVCHRIDHSAMQNAIGIEKILVHRQDALTGSIRLCGETQSYQAGKCA